MKRREDDPHKQARGLLMEWGGPYEAMKYGAVGAESDVEHYGTRIDGGGQHSDPTLQRAAKREHWMEIDAAVSLLPEHWFRILFDQYVRGLSDRQAADQAGQDRRSWSAERDSAHMLFLGRYEERRRLRQGASSGGESEGEAQSVVHSA